MLTHLAEAVAGVFLWFGISRMSVWVRGSNRIKAYFRPPGAVVGLSFAILISILQNNSNLFKLANWEAFLMVGSR